MGVSPRPTLTDRLRTDLGPHISGELLTDPDPLERYSRTQGWYSIRPLAVLAPHSVQDIQIAVRTCSSLGISIIPRGGGTGLAGHAVGFGLIIDTSRHLTHISLSENDTVSVGAGVILGDLLDHLRPSGRWFPIDPTSASRCTIGGMIATNASGWHTPLYGSTKDHVQRISLVLSDGSLAEIGPPQSDRDNGTAQPIQDRLEVSLRPHETLIKQSFPRVSKNSSGYDLPGALASTPLDLLKLITGSEGTLGVVAGASLRTMALPGSVGGVLLTGGSYDVVLEALARISDIPYAAAELLDRSYTVHAGLPDAWTDGNTSILLYVDIHAGTDGERDALLGQIDRAVRGIPHLRSILLTTPEERTTLFDGRKRASEYLNLESGTRKASFIDDGAVPPDRLGEYVAFLTSLLSEKGIPFILYGHAGNGNVHCAPLMDVRNLDHYRMIDEIAFRVADRIASLGGTLSGEHGDGFVRTPFVERIYGPDVFRLFRTVRETFDPQGIFHPGLITGPQNVSIAHDLSFA